MILVLIQLKIKAKRIQIIYTGLKKTCKINPVIKNMHETTKLLTAPTSLCRKKNRPVMLHRVIFGSLERFIGTLIEHYAGNFPLWLSPQQVIIIPIKSEVMPFAQEVEKSLKNKALRVSIDSSSETLNKKIRSAELQDHF